MSVLKVDMSGEDSNVETYQTLSEVRQEVNKRSGLFNFIIDYYYIYKHKCEEVSTDLLSNPYKHPKRIN